MAKKKYAMTDDELVSAIDQEMSSALGVDADELSSQRGKAMEYYLGEPLGNETSTGSSVRTREVMDTIEWIKPELMKLFASGSETVRFEPQTPEDIPAAQQATDYINYLFHRKNQGFKVLYQWITDGLLQKNGIVKVWYDQEATKVREEYEGLTQMEMELLLAPEEVELVDKVEVPGAIIEQQGMPMAPPMAPMAPTEAPVAPTEATQPLGGMVPPPGMPEARPEAPVPPQMPMEPPREPSTFNIAIIRTGGCNGIKVEVIPPEEFVISRKAKDIASSPMCAHRTMKTISDLTAMGFDTKELKDISSSDTLEYSEERLARYKYDDTEPEMFETMGMDDSTREVLVDEVYVRVDLNNDGLAELWKITKVGKTVLDKEEVDCIPFAGWTPIMISHKFHGLSMADLVMDLQKIQSQLFRNLLDNQYLTNNGRYEAVEGMVNMDDLLSNRPGGVVRTKMKGAVGRLDTPQLGTTAFQMMEYVDRMREKRTGVSERSQGLDPNQLNANTAATAVNQVMTAAQQRVELIARVFGETGLTDLFRLMYKYVIQYNNQKEIFRLRDTYVEVNPAEWKERADTSVVVGLGNGSREQEMMQLTAIIQNQQQMAANPAFSTVVTPTNVYNALEDQVKVFDTSASGRYYSDPASPQAQQAAQQAQQQQQAEMQKQEQMMQMQMQLEQARVEIERLKAESNKAHQEAKINIDQQQQALAEEQHEDEIAIKTAELEMEYELEKEQGRGVSLG